MPTSLIPQLRHAKVETYLQTGTCLSVIHPSLQGGEKSSLNRLWLINCRMWLPHVSRIVSRCERSTHTSRDQHVLSSQSTLLTTWTFTCIGVLHISDMYASCIIVQVSLSLLGTTPNTNTPILIQAPRCFQTGWMEYVVLSGVLWVVSDTS